MLHSKRNLEDKNLVIFYLVCILIIALLFSLFYPHIKLVYSNPHLIKQFILGFGINAPMMLILMQIIQVVIFFIPGQVFIIAGGYVFGPWWGAIYSLTGIMIGTAIVFYISRKFGRPFVERIVHKKELQHFDVFFKKRGNVALFIARITPVLFPNDIVSFAAGLTSLKFRDFLVISFFGFLPQVFVLNFFGNRLTKSFGTVTILIITILIFVALCYIFRHALKVFFIREIKEFEQEIEKIEHESIKEIKIVEKDVTKDYKIIKKDIEKVEDGFVKKKKRGKKKR